MLVASFILSPLACSRQRSEPARSHTVSLRGRRNTHKHTSLSLRATRSKNTLFNNPSDLRLVVDLLADVPGGGRGGGGGGERLWVDVQHADREDAVAV